MGDNFYDIFSEDTGMDSLFADTKISSKKLRKLAKELVAHDEDDVRESAVDTALLPKKMSSHERKLLARAVASNTEFGDDLFQSGSMDTYFSDETKTKKANRRKVAKLSDLVEFHRVGNTLVHKATQDLWELKKADDGEFVIERKFDANGKPLKL